MKYVVVIPDGMADEPVDELGGKTPVVASNTPNMDFIAANGFCGHVANVPDGMTPGSDVANLSIMGFNPSMLTGRGPLEAPSVGVTLEDGDVAFRCNLMNVEDDKINDFTAGHITTSEATELIKALDESFKDIGHFYPGVSYRNLFVMDDLKSADLKSTPPHDSIGEDISEVWLKPDNELSYKLNQLMLDSMDILVDHPVNKKRVSEGKLPANMAWIWGQGPKPDIGNFTKKYNLKGATITGVDLLKGISEYIDLDIIDVPGATGYFDTDYQAKADYAINAIKEHDVLFIHIEAPDEAGHAGDIEEKIKAIESIDSIIIGRLLKELKDIDEEYTIAVLPDHPTPINKRVHTMTPVPFALYSTSIESPDACTEFSESMTGGKYDTFEGYKLFNELIKVSQNK
ncbi:MAG: cofactor-independent phosphoglycerate mutase [Methanobacteriaceae archaeon]|nr:cofactor-independent phosphoglycerate mutase [Methanobacteriaceae archaeon]